MQHIRCLFEQVPTGPARHDLFTLFSLAGPCRGRAGATEEEEEERLAERAQQGRWKTHQAFYIFIESEVLPSCLCCPQGSSYNKITASNVASPPQTRVEAGGREQIVSLLHSLTQDENKNTSAGDHRKFFTASCFWTSVLSS